MKCPFVIKKCTTCGKLLVAYTGNFSKKKNGKYGVASKCKICFSNSNKEYYENNKEDILKKNKEWRNNNPEKEKQRHINYANNNPEKIKKMRKEYYKNNKERILEQTKIYHDNHKDYYNEKAREFWENHPEKLINNRNKRRQKENEQGKGITKEQWIELFSFFNWECAYSGIFIGRDSKYRTIDHIVPINNNGEHEIWNLVPMYSSYNFSKKDKNMEEWYKQQEFYSEERLQKIYEWQRYAKDKWKA